MPSPRPSSAAPPGIQLTLDRALRVLAPLVDHSSGRQLSMEARQANELWRFLNAFRSRLELAAGPGGQGRVDLPALLAMQAELEAALQFVESAFLAPRLWHADQQALVAADWLCVEAFVLFMGTSANTPIGPLVAVDARQIPCVWSSEAGLPLPSLFQREPDTVAREGSPAAGALTLARFPLVCLPSQLVRSPAHYPLLSHEVGHAVDEYRGWSSAISAKLARQGCGHVDHWVAWMRELVADATGLLVSGEAFALAFADFCQGLSLDEEISSGSPYPGQTLRLALLLDFLVCLRPALARDPVLRGKLLATAPNAGKARAGTTRLVAALRQEFRAKVAPAILAALDPSGRLRRGWPAEQAAVRRAVRKLAKTPPGGKDPAIPFRLLPSVATWRRTTTPDRSAATEWAWFGAVHASVQSRPGWVADAGNWTFSASTLPSLRPTLLSPSGIKVPPVQLMVEHDELAFVGATNGQLLAPLRQAWQRRGGKPWRRLDIFFGSDTLLAQVERGMKVEDLIRERTAAERALSAFLSRASPPASAWSLHRFDGPAIFGSYFDAHTRGGRIHVSAQLLGTDLRQCPAVDHVWRDAAPTASYAAHLRHLDRLRHLARPRQDGAPILGTTRRASR